jgi:ferrous iron transport protein B
MSGSSTRRATGLDQAQHRSCAYVDGYIEAPPSPLPGATGDALVALAGNPNSGKTSIFNRLTGSNQHVANFPGVTVERKEGRTRAGDRSCRVVDLPGTYSLTAYSIEEIVARNFLVDARPDLVIDVLDASNLQRNLYLATQLLELERPLLLAANMLDIARRRGRSVDLAALGKRLGVPVVGVEGHRGRGIEHLRTAIADALEAAVPARPVVSFDGATEAALTRIEARLAADALGGEGGPPRRWTALRLLEGDRRILERLPDLVADPAALRDEAAAAGGELERASGLAPEVHLANQRHEAIRHLLEDCAVPAPPERVFRSDRVDSVLLNRWLGLPIFLGLMYLTFQLTFSLGEAPMGWIEAGFAALAGAIESAWPGGGALKSLLVDGVIGGVGGVLVFLPNIVLLFLCLTLMEDSGYMARAAFLMDRLMHRIGLHGKSFIPLLTGFGCSIPGIMGTRVLESERDRLLTMLVLPLMSCGARLPIYLLLIPAFFPEAWHAEMLFLIYAIGVGLAVGLAKLLRISVLKGEATPFVMELPPYKLPTLQALWQTVRLRCWLYLRKAGTLILGVSMLLWALASWPRPAEDAVRMAELERLAATGDESAWVEAGNRAAEERLQHSLLGRLGQALEPVMAPMGFDWRISTAMVGAFAAKEIFVAQMGVVFALGETDEGSDSLRQALQARYTPLIGFCVMLFALVSTPCMATFAVTRRESGSVKWAFFQLGGLTAMAWLLTTVVYQLGRLAGL